MEILDHGFKLINSLVGMYLDFQCTP